MVHSLCIMPRGGRERERERERENEREGERERKREKERKSRWLTKGLRLYI